MWSVYARTGDPVALFLPWRQAIRTLANQGKGARMRRS